MSIAVFTDELLLGSTGWGTGRATGGGGSAWWVHWSSCIRWVRHGHRACWQASPGVLVAVEGTADPLVHEKCWVVHGHVLQVLLGVVRCGEVLVEFGRFQFVGRCDLSES